MTQRSRFGNLATTFPPGISPAPSVARNVIVVTHDETNAQDILIQTEAAAAAAEASAQDSAESAASSQQSAYASAASAVEAADSAAAAAGYANALAHIDYGFFHDLPTDSTDYGATWV